MRYNAKRFVALLAAVTMCSAMLADSALAFEQNEVISSGAAQSVYADAKAINVYDSLGNDISNGKDAYIYLDNSVVAGGATATAITVKSDSADDELFCSEDLGTNNKPEVTIESVDGKLNEKKVTINAIHDKKACSAGTYTLSFSTKSGSVYRKVFIVVYQPTSDLSASMTVGKKTANLEFKKYVKTLDGIKIGTGTPYQDVKDEKGKVIKSAVDVLKETYADNYYATKYAPSDRVAYISTIANHKQQFNANVGGTDKPMWRVFDGAYYPGIDKTGKETTLAEINKDGLFTPKKNGTVTIMLGAMPTLPYQCKETDTEEGITSKTYNNNSYTEKFKRNGIDVKTRFSFKAFNNDTNNEVGVTIEGPDKEGYANHVGPVFIQVNIIKENPAKDMKFKNPPAGMQLGETAQLSLEMTPSYTGAEYTGATDVVEWTSSNEKVVTVDEKGLITAVGKGEATITAQGENPSVYTSVIIRVYSKATGIKISPSPASTRLGIPVSLTATLAPDNAEDEVVWTSSDPEIATVEAEPGQFGSLTQKAIVTGGTKKGTVTITARAKYSGVEAKCTVTVNDKINSDSIDLYSVDKDSTNNPISNGENVNLFNNRSVDIKAVLTAKDGTTPDDKIKWTVTNNSGNYITYSEKSNNILTVNSLSEGTATITASSTANPSIKKQFTVSVIRACERVTLKNVTGYSALRIGETASIEADLTTSNKDFPYNHDDRVKSWTSSNEKVATVSDNGSVKCVGYGTALITCTTLSGVTQKINIVGFIPSDIYFSSGTKPSTDGQSLPTAEITLKKDKDGSTTGTTRLAVAVMGANNPANPKAVVISGSKVKWTSSNPKVATVDESGIVTAVDVGEAIITAASGDKSTKAQVIVKAPVTLFDVTVDNCVYSPSSKTYTPVPVVSIGGKKLVKGNDYTIEYSDNTKISNGAKITVTGLGKYTGSLVKTFAILPKSLADSDIVIAAIPRQQAKNAAINPEPKITFNGITLKKDTDYTLRYSNNVKVTTATTPATISIAGRGNYTGSTTVEFQIYCEHPCSGIKNGKCELCGTVVDAKTKLSHDYKETKVAATYDAEGYTLHKCTKCGASYKTDTVAKLPKTDLSKFTCTLSSSTVTFTGSAIRPTVTVKNGSTTLKNNTDYTVSYTNNTKAGTATVTVTGKAKYSGKITKNFTIKGASISKATVTGIANKYYTGKAIGQAPVVKLGTKTLVKGTDYVLSYKNNKAIGKATVTITGKGNYAGTISKAFKINPKKTTLKSATSPKAKKLKVTYTKVAGVTGYEILYSTNSKYTKSTKTVNVKGAKNVSKTISKLKKGTYYVKVRSYKTVSGTKYYSGYSASKKVVVK